MVVIRKEVLYDIFLYLHKLYDVIDREWFLNILEGYRIGTRTLRLLWKYWYRLFVVVRES